MISLNAGLYPTQAGSLSIIPRVRVGYEKVDSQRGA